MSRFYPVKLPCPSCGEPVDFEAVASVNADRRPDLREAIIDSSFQRETCPKCDTAFRLDPQFVYLDIGRGQWMIVHPANKLAEWKELETEAVGTFDLAFGKRASDAARDIGKNLRARIVFGWAATREKLVMAEHKLDDVVIEMVKTGMLRTLDNQPVLGDTELRFLTVDGENLVFAWIESGKEQPLEIMSGPRSLYDDFAKEDPALQELRTSLSAGYFVDMNRLFVVPA
jgi:hypothetical protein